jgi:hypothetical protein
MIAGKFARVIARPQDQVIRLRDDDQFLVSLAVGHAHLEIVYICSKAFSKSPGSAGKGVKQ